VENLLVVITFALRALPPCQQCAEFGCPVFVMSEF